MLIYVNITDRQTDGQTDRQTHQNYSSESHKIYLLYYGGTGSSVSELSVLGVISSSYNGVSSSALANHL